MCPGCSVSSPLSQSQKAIWSLICKGFSVANIADKLKTTRQYVNQTRLAAEAKLATTLLDVAQVNDLQVTKLYPKQAMLLGYHPSLKRKAIITYTTSHGFKGLVLARSPRGSYRPKLPEPNQTIPNRHS